MGIVNPEAARRARRAAQLQALEQRKQRQARLDTALRLPPLPSGYRDPDGWQTDAPAHWYFVAGGDE